MVVFNSVRTRAGGLWLSFRFNPLLFRLVLVGLSLSLILVAGVLNAAPAKKKSGESSKQVSPKQVKTAGYAQVNGSAPKGGTIWLNMSSEPPTLHPIMSTDLYSKEIKEQVLDTLLKRDLNTYEWVPRMAEKWEVSKNGRVFTFYLRRDVVFHDGHPVTADDVKFSFDMIFEPQYNAAHMRPYYESIEKVEALDPYTIRATTKDTYFQNFESIATLDIVPKHIYSDLEKSKKMHRELVGCGPYFLDKFEPGQKIVLKRFDKWYGFSVKQWNGYHNLDQQIYRFVKDENVALEMVKKGDFDFLPLSHDIYVQKTVGAPWGKTVFKNKVENFSPKGYGFLGFNFRKEMFKDKKVRLALAHLLNREEINKKFRYDMSYLATGPEYIQNDSASKKVKPITYNPGKAVALLREAGWKDTEKKGILQKVVDGKPVEFRFTLIHAAKDREKYWTVYREDLKRVGIDMEIRLLEWNSFLKLADEGNFDMLAMGWAAGSIDWDPKQIWHSSSVTVGGSNFIAYKNPGVDALIDKARNEVDRVKRTNMLRKVYEMIAEDVPYVFLFNDRYSLYANSNKVGKAGDTMKYNIGEDTWWSLAASPKP